MYAISSAEKVSASEAMNSHIPNFFEFTAYGDPPPFQSESAVATFTSGVNFVYPQTKNKINR